MCDDSWDHTESVVVCLSLGYIGGALLYYTETGFVLNGPFVDEVQCVGNETDIAECSISTSPLNYTCQRTQRLSCGIDGLISHTPIRIPSGRTSIIMQISNGYNFKTKYDTECLFQIFKFQVNV